MEKDFVELMEKTLKEIDEINFETPWEPELPKWWSEMMGVKFDIIDALSKLK